MKILTPPFFQPVQIVDGMYKRLKYGVLHAIKNVVINGIRKLKSSNVKLHFEVRVMSENMMDKFDRLLRLSDTRRELTYQENNEAMDLYEILADFIMTHQLTKRGKN